MLLRFLGAQTGASPSPQDSPEADRCRVRLEWRLWFLPPQGSWCELPSRAVLALEAIPGQAAASAAFRGPRLPAQEAAGPWRKPLFHPVPASPLALSWCWLGAGDQAVQAMSLPSGRQTDDKVV